MVGNNNLRKLSIPPDDLGRFLKTYNFTHSTEFSTFIRTAEKRSYLKDPFELIIDGPNLILLENNVGLISTALNDLSLISVIAYTTLEEQYQDGLHDFIVNPEAFLQQLVKNSANESANIFLENALEILWNFKIFRQNSD